MLTSYKHLIFGSIIVSKMSIILNGSTADARSVLKPRTELRQSILTPSELAQLVQLPLTFRSSHSRIFSCASLTTLICSYEQFARLKRVSQSSITSMFVIAKGVVKSSIIGDSSATCILRSSLSDELSSWAGPQLSYSPLVIDASKEFSSSLISCISPNASPLTSILNYFQVSSFGFYNIFRLATIACGRSWHMIQLRIELRFLTQERATDSVA